MICIEANEYQPNRNTYRYIPEDILESIGGRVIKGLEARTGADVMICPKPLPLPFSKKNIARQIEAGAKLIQLKYGSDLTSSIFDDRLKESIARMNQWSSNHWQKILLFIGSFSIDRDKGLAKVNGQTSRIKYATLESSMMYWTMRGGSLDFPLARYELILGRLLKHEQSLSICREKYFYAAREKILVTGRQSSIDNELFSSQYQTVREIDDMRKTLITLPGLGAERVQAIWDNLEEKSILRFLDMLLEGELRNIEGIGAKTEEKIKKYLGIEQ